MTSPRGHRGGGAWLVEDGGRWQTSLRSDKGGARMEPLGLSLGTDLVTGAALVTVVGEVDLSSSERLREELETALHESRAVVVDVGGMSFIDSSGLNALVHAYRTAQGVGSDLRIRHPTPMFLRLLEITRLETVFVIDRDGDSASAS